MQGDYSSEKGTERYDHATGTFIKGPPMPVKNVFGGCAAYDSVSGLVYMVFKPFKSTANSKFFSFDPAVAAMWTTMGDPDGFTELTDFPISTRYPVCGMVPDVTTGNDVFMAAGGYM